MPPHLAGCDPAPMGQEQRETIKAMLRQAPIDAGGDLDVQRPLFEEFMRQPPLPNDIVLTDAALGGVPILEIAAPGAEEDARVLYFLGRSYGLTSSRP